MGAVAWGWRRGRHRVRGKDQVHPQAVVVHKADRLPQRPYANPGP